MPTSLFVYGTLEIPEIVRAVTGRDFPAVPAVLPGHGRWLLRDRLYPGIIPDERCEVTGVLVSNIDRASLTLLDRFESDLYDRRTVRVSTASLRWADADAYVVRPCHRDLLTTLPWDRAAFVAQHLADFLPQCREFHAANAGSAGAFPRRT